MPELVYRSATVHGAAAMVAFYGPNREYAFVWHGGSYIDVCFQSSMGTVEIDDTYYQYGCQCINVYDYGDGATIIDWGDQEGFLNEIQEWFKSEAPVRTW